MQGKSRSYGRVALAAVGAASVAAALLAGAGTAAAAEAPFVPAKNPWPGGGFVVALKSGPATASASAVQQTAESLSSIYGGELEASLSVSMKGFVVWDMSAQEARRLAADPKVSKVFQTGTIRAADVQNNATWGIDRVDQRDLPLDTKYNYNTTASNVTVYVTDTGIKTNLADFEGRATVGADFVTEDGQDCNGHGTHVAGTIGSKTYGVAKKVKLVSVKMLGDNCSSSAPDSDGVQAIEWVTANAVKPAVVNASWTFDSADIGDQAISGMLASGVQMVAASGNSSTNACSTGPANVTELITVNATSRNDARASFSNFGTCTDIFAPGDGITSLGLSGSATTMSGTSMAAPHVAGVAALYLAGAPTASPQALRDALVNGATSGKVTNPGTGSPNKLLYSLIGGGGPDPEPPTCEGGSNPNDVTIPDTNTAITSDVAVTGCTGNADSTTSVKVDINHTYTADLKVELVGPSGRAYLLHAAAGIGSAAGIHQTFTVDASSETKNGTWKLRATDIYRHDTGTIDTWTLTF
jgi:subtilisin family serine protease